MVNILVMTPRRSERALHQILDILRDAKIEFKTIDKISESDAQWGDFLLTLGNDNDMLKAFHKISNLNIPILGVNENDEEKFLTELGLSRFRQVAKQIAKGKFEIEESKTLIVKTDGAKFPLAINEVAIFPHSSATLLEYTLYVDDEEIWTDFINAIKYKIEQEHSGIRIEYSPISRPLELYSVNRRLWRHKKVALQQPAIP